MQLDDPNSPGKKIGPELPRCMQPVVCRSQAQLTVKQRQGFGIGSPFGSLTHVLGWPSQPARSSQPALAMFYKVVTLY